MRHILSHPGKGRAVAIGPQPARCYTLPVSKKLSDANPYLRDPALRDRLVFKSVASSSAIEGISAPFKRMSSGAGKPRLRARGRTRAKTRVSRAKS